ncbi:MAG: hypothetical protein CVU05_13725 [Bacteroidetes bacterium HGW-Bacteroidetes-21]|jgi:hypothetical protein|nr:MAG: hypothetical protein CVU05_13725 [Bacteroidetes bacterium HGW-Bacteroidetes-21]
MKKSPLALIFIALLFFTSCNEYLSPVPAGPVSKSKILPEYLGLWEYVGQTNDSNKNINNESPHYLMIYGFNKHEYLIQMVMRDTVVKADAFQGLHRGFISEINGYHIVNFVELTKTEDAGYFIYNFGMKNDTFWVHGFDRYKMDKTFNSSCKLRSYLKKYLNDPSVFTPTSYYIKTEKIDFYL